MPLTASDARRILVVDDNESIHDDFDKILGATAPSTDLDEFENAFFGDSEKSVHVRPTFRVDHAIQGEVALEMVEAAMRARQPYAMAFVDMRMPPGWDGLQTIERLWAVDPGLHVVICTAYSDYSWEELLGRVEHPSQLLILKKPFDTAEVGQLASAMAEKRFLHGMAQLQMEDLQQRVISRTRQLEEATEESERFINAISSIVFGIDERGCISRWNTTSESVFGFTAHDVIGKPLADLPIAWDDTETLLEILLAGDAAARQRTEFHFTDTRGTHRIIGASVFPMTRDDQPCGCLVLASDLTDTRNLEQQLRAAQKLEAVGQLAAGVAHEINTPMQYIGDNLDYLSKSFEQLQQIVDWVAHQAVSGAITETLPITDKKLNSLRRNIPSALTDASEGVAHVSQIVRAMKAFSHPGQDTRVAVDVNKALQNTLTVATNEWKYVATVKTDLEESERTVEALHSELNQAFLNLIVNAAHAIEESATGNGQIHVTTRFREDGVEVRIADTGCGVPTEVRSRIFDPFFTTKEVGRGTGQGLAITYNVIVQQHGGKLWFESEQDIGTTFYILLPYTSARHADAAIPVAAVQ